MVNVSHKHHVLRYMSCQKATVKINKRAHGFIFHDYIFITSITILCAMDDF